MGIELTKTIPTDSDWYSGGGNTTIEILGDEEININTKKDLIKIVIPQSNSTQTANFSDKGKGFVLDLKRVEDTIKVRGWLEDDETETAWNKAWKLRAMTVTGGPLVNFKIDNVEFKSGTQQCFLEECAINVDPRTDLGSLDSAAGDGTARVTVDLSIYVGDPK